MKDFICAAIGAIGAAIVAAFGGWDAALTTLVIFMAADYIMGLLVAGVFHASRKTEHGGLESRAGWKGLVRKCVTLLLVGIAARLDLMLGADYVKNAVIIAFCVNELISITENAALMGIPMPKPIEKAIELLRAKGEQAPVDKDVNYKTGYFILLDEKAQLMKELEAARGEGEPDADDEPGRESEEVPTDD